MPPYQREGKPWDHLEITEKVIKEIVTLPMYPQMDHDDLDYMVDAIQKIINELT
jgi:dTDP-4-amino-4,6-dideoxygalactose transaminase